MKLNKPTHIIKTKSIKYDMDETIDYLLAYTDGDGIFRIFYDDTIINRLPMTEIIGIQEIEIII